MTTRKYILASNSPRRRELLAKALGDVEIASPLDVDESYPDNLPVEEVARYVARSKAEAYAHLVTDADTVLITADTVVVCDDKVLGKPADRAEAMRMLEALNARTHRVFTGYALVSKQNGIEAYSECTEVTFSTLTRHEIEHYVDTYKPYDKAGAYGIQEWIGLIGIERINGDFYNVMGLPVCALYHKLKELD